VLQQVSATPSVSCDVKAELSDAMSKIRTRSTSPCRRLSLLQRIDGELRDPPKGPRAGERQIFSGVKFFCFPGGHDRQAVSELREEIQVSS
jgi:hypothetical protein